MVFVGAPLACSKQLDGISPVKRYLRSMNSNLTPVPRTDKNGRVTTRHMKAAAASGSSATIPPVRPPAAPATNVMERANELFTAIYGSKDNSAISRNNKRAIYFMNKQHPELLETVNMLLAKNDRGGSNSVRTFMMESLRLLGDQLDMTDEEDVLRLSYVDGLSAEFEESIVRVWAVGSVRGEFTGTRYNDFYDNDFLDGIAGMRLMIYGNDTDHHPKKETDTDYWRGATAIYYADPNGFFETTEEQKEGHRFIEWAGNHDDINLAIHTAIERDTIDVGTLDGVLLQEVHAPAMSKGIL